MKTILIGAAAGILSGMGVGGGMILIPMLSFFSGLGQHEAQSVNLFYFLPTALAAVIVHAKNRRLDLGKTVRIAAVGIPFAIIGAFGASCVASSLLKKIFGVFLGIFGIIEVYHGFTNKE